MYIKKRASGFIQRNGVPVYGSTKLIPQPVGNLISQWTFDASNGVDTANSYDLYTNAGTPTYGAGQVNTCLVLDGSSNMTNTAYYSGFTTQITMAFWYKCSAQTSDGGVIIVDDSIPVSHIPAYYILIGGSKWEFRHLPWAGWFPGPDATVDNNWHFIIVQNNNGAYEMWEDNVSIGTLSPSILYPGRTPGNYIKVGGYVNDPKYNFKGSLDQIRIYNKILTSGERSALWNGGAGI